MNSLFQGSYDNFDLSSELHLGLKDLGYSTPTFVQNEVFLPIEKGGDYVVQSHTGSGKTTAFCLPILKRLQKKLQSYPQVLILAPTRELAKQVATECSRLGHHAGIKTAVIYGGTSFEAQKAALEAGAQIIIGTPGRTKDLLNRKILDLSKVEVVILDEADEMLSMGFWEDVTYLLKHTAKKHQTLLFSATLTPIIEQSLDKISNKPKTLNFSSDTAAAKSIRHVLHIENDSQIKSRNLLYALELHKPTRALVFCNTKNDTELVHKYLGRFSFKACALNGDMNQNAREKVLQDIKSGTIDIVVATDVAARGIDIPDLSHVFNYELPDNSEIYVHRTGRTGRMGKLGTAISLIRAKDLITKENLKRDYDINFEEIEFPSEEELLWMQGERLSSLLIEQADGVEISQYRNISKSMIKRGDASEILAFLLRSHFSKAQKPAQKSRPERSQKTPHYKEPKAEPPFKQIYITLGREDGFEELTELANHVADLSGVDLGHFTGIGNLRDTSSHLEVDSEVAEKLKKALHDQPRPSGVTEKLICDIAAPRPPRRPYRRR